MRGHSKSMVRRLIGTCVAATATAVAALVIAPAALGAEANSQWQIVSLSQPTRFTPGLGNAYQLIATNVGNETTTGKITVKDELPAGVRATAVYGALYQTEKDPFVKDLAAGDALREFFGPSCTLLDAGAFIECEYEGQMPPSDSLAVVIALDVIARRGMSAPANLATVEGGAAAAESAALPTDVVSVPESKATPYGFSGAHDAIAGLQAGAHSNFTTSFALATTAPGEVSELPRDIEVQLPAGLLADARALPQCNIRALEAIECEPDTAVGVATSRIQGGAVYNSLIYNIVPYRGEPAAFAYQLALGIAKVRLDTQVVPDASAPGGYVAKIVVLRINESERVLSSSVTIWGTPAEWNGPGPYKVAGGQGLPVTFGEPSEEIGPETKAFMRSPTSCQGPLTLGLRTDSWQKPGVFAEASALLPGADQSFTGCGMLDSLFTPTIEVHPDATSEASPGSHTYRPGMPSGYEVGVEVPQEQSFVSSNLATPDVRDVTLTLPNGVVASPSVANGLEVCTEAQLAPTSTEAAKCPQASQIGTVTIESPLLEKPMSGQVFLGAPECAPCSSAQAGSGSMVRLFLQAAYGEGASYGKYVRIKLMGRTRVSQSAATLGQLTTTFENNPQLPFSKLTLHLEGGPNAALANPSACGAATATTSIVPWSSNASEPFEAAPTSAFMVEGCTSPQFKPSFTAGTTATTRGGAYSPFVVRFGRTDKDQTLSAITVHTPPGLLGMVSHVTQCGEAQANAGTCSSSSEIGAVTAAVGPGSDPYWITGGKAFLTGPYAGKPFGLSIVVPAVAGPFTLAGETGDHHEGDGSVVVRASIAVDPHTAALTIASNPMPQQLDGIPLQVRTIDVDINRADFMRNATNCEAMSIGAQVLSVQGSSPTVSAPYQAKDCASLPFHPGFAVDTKGRHTRKGGAYLHVKVTSSEGQANIHEVHVALPKKLPARNSTLKLACTEAQFAANPAGCPAGSFVGTATAQTPVLTSALSGPAVYVSHGGRSFPDLDMVLQGEGVTVILAGNTFISKKGITTSTFKTVPDVPVSRFDLTLPESSHSALSGFGNFCTKTTVVRRKRVKLRRKGHVVRRKGRVVYTTKKVKRTTKKTMVMPTTITGQNGAVVTQRTKIAVAGCNATGAGKAKGAARGGRGRASSAPRHHGKGRRRHQDMGRHHS